MQTQNDNKVFDWIRRGRHELADSRNPPWVGNFVSHLMPPVFEAYAKILHHIEASYENIDKPLSFDELSVLKLPSCEELKSFVGSQRAKGQGPRIRWKELAEVLNVPFIPPINHEWYRNKLELGCWPRFLDGPGDGLLNQTECKALISILRLFTVGGSAFFRFAEIPFIGTDKPLLFHGALDELVGFLDMGAYRCSPEYWWPTNQSWCVCSDYDLTFTFVGGSRELISALLTNDVLECVEVTPQTRVDSYAPMP